MAKVIVISMLDSKRRDIISSRLKKVGVNSFEFFDAYNAVTKSQEDLAKVFDTKKFEERYSRIPAKGEIGCTISHYRVWERIASSNENNWVILEDDAILTKGFSKIANACYFPDALTSIGFSKFPKWKSFMLGFKYPLNNSVQFSGGQLGYMESHNFRGTVGYIITKDVAKTLYYAIKKPSFITDDFDYIRNYVDVKCIRPLVVFEDFKNLESSIKKEREILNNSTSN